MRVKLLQYLLILAFSFSSQTNYEVSFMGMHAADIQINRSDTLFHEQQAVAIQFAAENRSISSMVFPIEIRYNIIITPDTYKMLSFAKFTNQPGVKNSFHTVSENEVVKYALTEIIFPTDCFNIFSLLDYLANNQTLDRVANPFCLEREGLFYSARLNGELEEKNKFELILNPAGHEDQTAVVENTDIFTWAVFKENAKRYIWIDPLNKKISRCEFQFGWFKLTAEIKD